MLLIDLNYIATSIMSMFYTIIIVQIHLSIKGLVIVVPHGCSLNDCECNDMREYITGIVEKVYNHYFVDLTIITHDINTGIIARYEFKEDVLIAIEGLSCSDITYDDYALEQAYDVLSGKSYDESKIVFMSFCDSEDGNSDYTCNVSSYKDPTPPPTPQPECLTSQLTETPSINPTPRPSPRSTTPVCEEIDYDFDLRIVASNGCELDRM